MHSIKIRTIDDGGVYIDDVRLSHVARINIGQIFPNQPIEVTLTMLAREVNLDAVGISIEFSDLEERIGHEV